MILSSTSPIKASNNNGYTIAPLHHTISVITQKKTTSKWDNFSYSANGRSEVAMNQVEDEELNIYQTDLTLRGGWPQLQFK